MKLTQQQHDAINEKLANGEAALLCHAENENATSRFKTVRDGDDTFLVAEYFGKISADINYFHSFCIDASPAKIRELMLLAQTGDRKRLVSHILDIAKNSKPFTLMNTAIGEYPDELKKKIQEQDYNLLCTYAKYDNPDETMQIALMDTSRGLTLLRQTESADKFLIVCDRITDQQAQTLTAAAAKPVDTQKLTEAIAAVRQNMPAEASVVICNYDK